MTWWSLAARVLLAIMLTSFASAALVIFLGSFAIFAVGAMGAETANSDGLVLAGAFVFLTTIVGPFWAQIWSLPAAFLIGLCLELPKAWWISRSEGKFLISVVVSMIFALGLSIFVPAISSDPVPTGSLPMIGSSRVAHTLAYLIGGLVSACVWWIIVVEPWRKKLDMAKAT